LKLDKALAHVKGAASARINLGTPAFRGLEENWDFFYRRTAKAWVSVERSRPQAAWRACSKAHSVAHVEWRRVVAGGQEGDYMKWIVALGMSLAVGILSYAMLAAQG
jgi:hypothetical protein